MAAVRAVASAAVPLSWPGYTRALVMDISRFFSHVEKTTTCWIWKGCIGTTGYGCCDKKYGDYYAHRASYKIAKGNIPYKLQIDHLCKNKKCVNPEHLEAVTQRENIRRGESISTINARRTSCDYGHQFTEQNTFFRPSWNGVWYRSCKKCKADSDSAYYHATKRLRTTRRATS